MRCFDYLNGHPEGVCRGHTGEVTALTFVPGYPLILSADSAGTVIAFALRPAAAALQHQVRAPAPG